MRRLSETDKYQYGILFDAFGFFESDDENEDVVGQLGQAVSPGGGVVIAVVNGERILNMAVRRLALAPVTVER